MAPTLKFAAAAGLAFILGLGVSPLVMPADEGGFSGPGGLSAPEQTDDQAFPTGTFVSVEDPDLWIAFHEDGGGRTREEGEGTDVGFTYATQGNLWTEMTHDETAGRLVPATYFWDFDGELLTFELWGEDLVANRKATMENNTWTHVPDPREVVAAARDILAGDDVYANSGVLRVLPATEVGPGALTDRRDISGHIAAVDIAAGQPLTLDLLEPSAD